MAVAGPVKFARTIAAAVPIATPPNPSFAWLAGPLQASRRPDMAARSGTSQMSKKPRKTASRKLARAAVRKPQKVAAKRPTPASDDATPERIAQALEAIALHLSAAAPAGLAAGTFGPGRRLVWAHG